MGVCSSIVPSCKLVVLIRWARLAMTFHYCTRCMLCIVKHTYIYACTYRYVCVCVCVCMVYVAIISEVGFLQT